MREDLTGIRSYDALAGIRLGVIEGFANGREIDSLPAGCKTAFAGTREL